MIGNFKNNLTVAVNVLYAEMLQRRRKKYIPCLHFKIKLKLWKTKYSFDDFKQRRMALCWN